MSHKSSIATKLDNVSYITRALDELGVKYKLAKEGKQFTTKGDYNVHEKVDLIITEIDGKSTNEAVGLVKSKDGTYECTGDFFNVKWTEKKLRNFTTTQAKKIETNDRLIDLGFEVSDTQNNDEELELTYSRWV